MVMPRIEYWKQFQRRRETHQRWGERRIVRGLQEQVETILEVLPEGAAQTLGNLDQLLKTEPLVRAYQDLYGRVGRDFAGRSFTSLEKSVHANLYTKQIDDEWLQWMRNFAVTEAGSRIQAVSDVTLTRIRRTLEQGVSEGLGIEDIARRLQSSNAVNRVRGRVIARTEIISASNAGSDLGARSTGLNLNKEWIATPDGRERETHGEANGQVVGMGELFIVGGQEAKYPGDPNLSAEESIQCRCTHAFIPI
jgi:hypothetical protein